jgi:hypothetical protein
MIRRLAMAWCALAQWLIDSSQPRRLLRELLQCTPVCLLPADPHVGACHTLCVNNTSFPQFSSCMPYSQSQCLAVVPHSECLLHAPGQKPSTHDKGPRAASGWGTFFKSPWLWLQAGVILIVTGKVLLRKKKSSTADLTPDADGNAADTAHSRSLGHDSQGDVYEVSAALCHIHDTAWHDMTPYPIDHHHPPQMW